MRHIEKCRLVEFAPVEEVFVTNVGKLENHTGVLRVTMCSPECLTEGETHNVARVKLIIPEHAMHMICRAFLMHFARKCVLLQ